MLTSTHGDPRRQKGFSLFEVLIVVVLFALAAAVVLPSFSSGFKGIELETTARDLATRMKQARSEAIARQEVFRMVLRNGEELASYTLTDAYEEEIERFDLPEGVRFEGVDEQEAVVSFYPNGRSSGSEFSLRSQSGRRVSLEVDSVTGFARVVRPAREGQS